MFFNKSKTTLIVFLLTLIAGIVHFYNLTWGAPFYFHPDERNIASSVSQLQFSSQMNPHFFAYGSLPIYTTYFTGYSLNFLINLLNTHPHTLNPNFEQAIIIGRLYSALFATLLIPVLFYLGKKLKNENTGLIASFLGTTSVGLMQFAHFGTFEMWLTFFTVVLFWFCLSLPKKLTKKSILLLGLFSGILVSIKISHLIIIPCVIALLACKEWFSAKSKIHTFIFRLFYICIFFLITCFLVYGITNPFVFLDTASFINSMQYESSLALGTLPVFYTGEFFNTLPVLFQFLHIYPFLLNPLITIILIPSSFYLLYKGIKTKNSSYSLLFAFCSLLFLSQAFFFAKWTRYMVPTLPFIFLIIGIALTEFLNKKTKFFKKIAIASGIFICCLFFFSYFITAFVRPDTRVAAYDFSKDTIPQNATILSEVYDLGIVPFNASFKQIRLFNFYDLDNNSLDANTAILQKNLRESDYIILPSQRVLKTRLMNKEKFPKGNAFYEKLLAGELGFKKIYETPCDIYCKVTYLGDPVFRFEQTANVFDRPQIMIFKKIYK